MARETLELARPLLRGLVPLEAARGLLVLGQAELLVRALAPPDAGPLPWLGAAVALRAGVSWAAALHARRVAADAKARVRVALLRARGGPDLVVRGPDALDPFLTRRLPRLVAAAVVAPLVLARVLAADLAAGLTLLAVLVLVPVLGVPAGRYARDAARLQRERLDRLGGHFRDAVAGLPTLRAFDRVRDHEAEVRRTAERHRRASRRALRTVLLPALVLDLVAALAVVLVAVPAGLRSADGSLGQRTALLVLLLTLELLVPLRALGGRLHAAPEAPAVAAAAVLERAESGPGPGRAAGAVPPPDGEIRLENVTVRRGDRLALDRVSLVVRPGEAVAVSGPSGAGKSTLLAVIHGRVRPDEGRVLVGGVDLRDVDRSAWLARIAWVPPDPHLFAESVADNVRLGAPRATAAEVRDALVRARAHEFVQSLPDGHDTVLGEGGAALSAGERQRIALARAYLRDAPILLLDEPAARLDARGENAVVHSARQLLRGRTAVLVAHRPALLVVADRVIRLGEGRVLEEVHR